MKQYALVVKQDEMSANIAEKIKKGLTGIMEYNAFVSASIYGAKS